VRERHRRRHPERKQKTKVQRMPHIPIRRGRAEAHRRIWFPNQGQPHLAKTEQVEMVDQERDDEHGQPSGDELAPEYGLDEWIFDRPDRDADGPPLPEQQKQCKARTEHERRALDRPGHDLRPPLLEPSPRHHAVLHGEDRQQQRIDSERGDERAGRIGIQTSRHREATDKRDGVEERGEEHDVGNYAVSKERQSFQHGHPPVYAARMNRP